MSHIQIIADSACDLSEELQKKHNIRILPLYVNTERGSFSDGEITPPDLFSIVKETGSVPKTAAISIADCAAVYAEYPKETSIIHFNISSGFSSCYQNAHIASEDFPNVTIIDSKNLSSGIALSVLAAAEMAENGATIEEIVAQAQRNVERTESSFVIDTLEFLHKGGRCSSLAALGANLLQLKPCIEVKDGGMVVGKKYRGTIKKALLAYVEDRLTGRDDIDAGRIFITHSYCDPALVEEIRQKVSSILPFDDVIVSTAGCTISSHCGPNTLGILFFRK